MTARLHLRDRAAELVTLALVIAADQLTKAWVVATIALDERVPVVPRLFELTHLLNAGGVWGIGRDFPPLARAAVFLALPVLVTLFAAWYSWGLPREARWRRMATALVVAGALGNLIDRVRLEPAAVIDFLVVHLGSYTWPAFNVADSAICVGFGILLVTSFADDEDGAPAAPGPGGP